MSASGAPHSEIYDSPAPRSRPGFLLSRHCFSMCRCILQCPTATRRNKAVHPFDRHTFELLHSVPVLPLQYPPGRVPKRCCGQPFRKRICRISIIRVEKNIIRIGVCDPLPGSTPIYQFTVTVSAVFMDIRNNSLKRAIIQILRLSFRQRLPEGKQFVCLFSVIGLSVKATKSISLQPILKSPKTTLPYSQIQ